MSEVFGASDDGFTLQDSLQRQHAYRSPQPFQLHGLPEFAQESIHAIHSIKKIDRGAVLEDDHGVRHNVGLQGSANIEHSNVLPGREVDPNVGVQGAIGNALEDGCRHAGDQKPDFFPIQGLEQVCKRRKCRIRAHRSSGVEARLRA